MYITEGIKLGLVMVAMMIEMDWVRAGVLALQV